MKSFRNWLGLGRGANRPFPQRPSARPTLEALEDRNLLNASVAFDAAGNMAQVVVFNNGNAYMYTNTGATLIGQSVRVAHVFRDAGGKIGLDIVYNNGNAYEFTSTGSTTLGVGNVLDASRAYDARGNFKLDVLYNNGLSNGTGNLFEYTNTGVTQLSQTAIFATAYVDVNGQLGRAVGILDTLANNIQAFAQDSTGTRTLYKGSSGGDPVTDYDQSSPAIAQTNALAQTLVDLTFGFGGCIQIGPGTAVNSIGSDNVQKF